MKLRIKEITNRERYDKELKMNLTIFNTIFEGEVEAIQFPCHSHSELVADPSWMSQDIVDGFIELYYGMPNNISCEIDERKTLWIRPKMTAEELAKLTKSQKQLKIAKREKLAKCPRQ